MFEDINGGALFPDYLILKDCNQYMTYSPYNKGSNLGTYKISNDTLYLNETYSLFRNGDMIKLDDTIIDNCRLNPQKIFLMKNDKLIEITDYEANCKLYNNKQLRCDYRKIQLRGHRFEKIKNPSAKRW
jgi:hypothetical protein